MGSNSVSPGLATIAPANVRTYLTPLINAARAVIPAAYQAATPIHVYGTAGMRLLTDSDAEAVWTAVFAALSNSTFSPFRTQSAWVGTLSGEQEAAFGALAVDFISQPSDALFYNNVDPIGNLDLGGASTQIGFQSTSSLKSGKYDIFFQKGRVSYYADSFLLRGQDQAILAFQYFLTGRTTAPAGNVSNPCHPTGYYEVVPMTFSGSGNVDVTFVGTGDWQTCHDQIKTNLLHVDYECLEGTCSASGHYLPPLTNRRFYAVSAFFFHLQNLGVITSSSGSYNGDLQTIKNLGVTWCNGGNGAQYIGQQFLKTVCFINAYTIALFTGAYRFPLTGTSPVTFVNRINGFTVTWTLGAAVVRVQEDIIYQQL